MGLGLSLIVAIGAQNAFVLRQGLRLEHVGVVVAVCALSDVALIYAGVLGAGTLVLSRPGLLTVVCFAGAAFLLVYGVLAARRALRPSGALEADASGARTALAVTVATCLGLTWLNPHVYLDTVVLLGSLSTTYEQHRWWFATGAAVGSALWFTGLGFGARLLRPIFARRGAWRVLDAVIAVVMAALGISLAVRGVSGG
ncbi:amino acid transporter [Blastococcus sp. CCUG 61487]|nr:amino acid transporter [Blastococcus sp. CCUG 61487]